MVIALIAATRFEIEPTIGFLERSSYNYNGNQYEVLVTGLGMMATAYQLSKYLAGSNADILIQAGIGGSFSNNFLPGAVVMIREEVIGDMGAEENGTFRDVFDLGFMQGSTLPFVDGRLPNSGISNWAGFGLPLARGLTVNEITTRAERITVLQNKYGPEIESMEGAAFHFVCLQHPASFVQIRAVSNHVGERDKSRWKLREAIENLNNQLIRILQQL